MKVKYDHRSKFFNLIILFYLIFIIILIFS